MRTRWIGLVAVGVLLLQTLCAAVPVRAAPTGQSNTVIHVVQRGETLYGIARHYGVSVEAVCAANGITNPRLIYVGQRLVIPAGGTPAGAAPPAAGGSTHVVQPGENLYRIALRYGTTVTALAEANGISNPAQIYAGQTLRIPGSVAPTPAAAPPQQGGGTHTVRPGETLSAIALRYGVSVWALAQINGIANPSLIFPGQVLVIPEVGALPAPPVPAPAVPGGRKRIVIDISEQRLYAYQDGALVHVFVVSTGMGNSTRIGHFSVLDKIPNAYASTWDLQMPYWLGIYWSGSLENGIHALPILSNGQRLWEGYLGRPASFGCIILDTPDAITLYYWAEVGTPVDIQH